MKAIVFDTGILITFSMNSILNVLRDLKKGFDGKFIITRSVESEAVKRPMTIMKYKLGAMNIKALIDEKVLEFPESLNINSNEIENQSQKILDDINSIFYTEGRALHLIDKGEASALALNKILKDKGIKSVIAIDERTTRMIGESPLNLQKLLEEKLHSKINIKRVDNPALKDVIFIRSAELVYVAYKKGLIKKDKELLDAMLYGVKFKGCSISHDEIKEIEKLA